MPPNPILIIKAPILFGVLRFLEHQVSIRRVLEEGRGLPNVAEGSVKGFGLWGFGRLWVLRKFSGMGFSDVKYAARYCKYHNVLEHISALMGSSPS